MLDAFARFLKAHHARELAADNIRLLHALQPPFMKHLNQLPPRHLLSVTEQGTRDLLTAWEEGTGRAYIQAKVKEWEEDRVVGIPREGVEASDIVLSYAAQKQAITPYVARFSRDPEVVDTVLRALDDHFATARSDAMEAFFRVRMANAHAEKKRQQKG